MQDWLEDQERERLEQERREEELRRQETRQQQRREEEARIHGRKLKESERRKRRNTQLDMERIDNARQGTTSREPVVASSDSTDSGEQAA